MRPMALLAAGAAALGAVLLPAGQSAQAHPVHPTAAGTVYYVDCTSTKASDGTYGSPWNSLADVNRHSFGPGDQLDFKAGTTCDGTLQPKGSGSSSAPVSTGSYGTGTQPVINGGGAAAAVVLTNLDYWTVTGLSVTDPASTLARRDGIQANVTDGAVHHGLVITGNTVDGVAGQTNKATQAADFAASSGIEVNTPTSATGAYSGVTVTHNSVSNTGGGGIKVRTGYDQFHHGSSVYLGWNTIRSVGGDGIVVSNSDHPLVEHNSAYDLGKGTYPYTGGNFAGMWGLGDVSPTFQFNEVARSVMSVADSEAFDCDWGNSGTCLFQYNYEHDNAGGILLDCNLCGGTPQNPSIVFRYNIAQNDCRAVDAGNDNSAYAFYGNTVYCPGKTLGTLSGDNPFPADAKISDNILVFGSGTSLQSGPTYTANTYFGFTPPSTDAQASTADPEFSAPGTGGDGMDTVNGYELKAGSPAIGSGVVIAGNGGRDYWGNPVSATAAPNRGAYNGAGV